jgi:hypothetical protein
MLPDVLALAKVEKRDALVKRLTELGAPEMFGNEGRRRIAGEAKALAGDLRDLAKQPIRLVADEGWLARLSENRRLDRNWDEATQRYFALSALQQAHKDNPQAPQDAGLKDLIRALRPKVTFDADYGSPKRFVPSAK